jgi:hypothetical protein
MDTLAPADQTPIAEFLRLAVQEPGIPGQWHRDRSTISQIHRKRVCGNSNMLDGSYVRLNQ